MSFLKLRNLNLGWTARTMHLGQKNVEMVLMKTNQVDLIETEDFI